MSAGKYLQLYQKLLESTAPASAPVEAPSSNGKTDTLKAVRELKNEKSGNGGF
jgi:hypothetical protein